MGRNLPCYVRPRQRIKRVLTFNEKRSITGCAKRLGCAGTVGRRPQIAFAARPFRFEVAAWRKLTRK